MDQNLEKDAVAVGKIPSGLFIVTTMMDGRREGYLASWVQQTSFSPLLISLSVKPGRPCYAALKGPGRFCVNIVGHQNGGIMKPFWNVGEGDPFAGLDVVETARGNLILRNALAAIECQVRSSVVPGDHEVIFAEVVENHLLNPEDKPLTHVRKSGLIY